MNKLHLIFALILLSCKTSQDKKDNISKKIPTLILDSISLDGIENNCSSTSENKKIQAYTIYFFGSLQNNTNDTFCFGTSNHPYSKEKPKFGYFYIVYNEIDTFILNCRLSSYLTIHPGKSEFKIESMDKKLMSLFFEDCVGYKKEFLNKIKMYYQPIIADYQNAPYKTIFNDVQSVKLNPDFYLSLASDHLVFEVIPIKIK